MGKKEEPDAARERVVTALCARLARDGYAVAAEGACDVARTMLVAVGARWVSVYDQATEAQRVDDLDDLAQALSDALGTTAAAVLVHDSDVLRLALFDKGRARDVLNVPDEAAEAPPLRGSVWLPLLERGVTLEALRTALQKRDVFAEDILRRAAPLIGMDSERCCLGYTYASETEHEFRRLRFVHREPPQDAPPAGPPRFDASVHVRELAVAVGEPLRLRLQVRNAGGAGTGVVIAVWGDALDEDLVAVHRVRLFVDPLKNRDRPPLVEPVSFMKTAEGTSVGCATFGEAVLPAGAGGDPFASALQGARQAAQALFDAAIAAEIEGDVVAPGEGTLKVGFVPGEHEAGQYGYAVRLTSHVASRRPLRAPPDAGSRLLRVLEDPSILFGIVALDTGRERAGELSARVVERWAHLFSEEGRYHASLVTERDSKPLSRKAAASGYRASGKWSRLLAELPDLDSLLLQHVDTEPVEIDGIPYQRSDGFAFRSVSPGERGDDDECAALSVWLNVHDRPESVVEEARALLIALLDDCMKEGAGIQALMGRWGRAPDYLPATAYETACGLYGRALQRRRLTRYLRGVTSDWIWLGEALLTRVDRGRLDAVARVEPVGATHRFQLRSGRTLDELEAALSDLLPAAGDS